MRWTALRRKGITTGWCKKYLAVSMYVTEFTMHMHAAPCQALGGHSSAILWHATHRPFLQAPGQEHRRPGLGLSSDNLTVNLIIAFCL